ncbi:MAG: polysaccharide deacetylase family protein [Acidobacteria bacterium]|nr:polysaccharide deacetylase family protein [Acidobacteriota bacterium]MCG2815899.1 polysaccharide deacetylase family protein [Candidatus Aminicenantes bacterium]
MSVQLNGNGGPNGFRPPAAISFDLDNFWSYAKTHGDPGWESYPSYFDVLLPRVCDLLDEEDLRITFFIVGRDASLSKNGKALELIAGRGHSAGNHSFNHEPWYTRNPRDRIAEEIDEAERAVLNATGLKTTGFRGPGFSWSPDVFDILLDRGYTYDATTLPSFLGPLGRLYYFTQSRLSSEQKEERKILFGGIGEGLRPLYPYVWLCSGERRLLEIPVTTLPVFKVPVHLSYLLYLSRFGEGIALSFFQQALRLMRMTGSGLSFLLHPLDFLDAQRCPELSFFPGMDLNEAFKADFFSKVIRLIRRYFRPVSLDHYARLLQRSDRPPVPLRTVPVGGSLRQKREE